MAKYVVRFSDGTYADTKTWHTPVAEIDRAKVFQTKSAASNRANHGFRFFNGPTRLTGQAIRVELKEVE